MIYSFWFCPLHQSWGITDTFCSAAPRHALSLGYYSCILFCHTPARLVFGVLLLHFVLTCPGVLCFWGITATFCSVLPQLFLALGHCSCISPCLALTHLVPEVSRLYLAKQPAYSLCRLLPLSNLFYSRIPTYAAYHCSDPKSPEISCICASACAIRSAQFFSLSCNSLENTRSFL